MELKEYLAIFKKNIRIFVLTIMVIFAVGAAYFFWQPIFFNASLNLNITRSGTQETNDYRYDNFYRLQADERFSDTVVRWLESPRVAKDILEQAGIKTENWNESKLSKFFKARRLSSQYISINYNVSDDGRAKKISNSLAEIVNNEAEELNSVQREKEWFLVMADEPVVTRGGADYKIILAAALLLGIFVGTWMVFATHYFRL